MLRWFNKTRDESALPDRDAVRFLSRASELLASSLDLDRTLEHIEGAAVPELSDVCVIELADHGRRSSTDIPESQFRSRLTIPLKVHDRKIGTLILGITSTARSFDAHDTAIATELARRAAGALENARLFMEVREAQLHAEEQAVELEEQAAELEHVNEELAAAEAEQRALIEAMRDVVLVLDADGRYVRIPHTAPDLLYAPSRDLVGQRMHDVMPAEAADAFLSVIRQALEARDAVRTDYSLPINGRMVWFSAVVSPMSRDQVLWVSRDITPQREAEMTVRASEARYRLLFESNPMPMWVYDRSTLRFLSVNEAAVQQYGYTRDEFMAMTIADIRPAEDVDRLRSAVADSQSRLHSSAGWRHRRKDGALIDVEIVAHPIDYSGHDAELILALDVTSRKRVELQLRQAQKMEAVGQLAGGIAHDFNNLLTAITSYSELLLGSIPSDDSRHDDVAQIKHAANRAAVLTRQLLAFSRHQVISPEILSLTVVVAEMEKLLRRIVREDIEFRISLDPALGAIEADRGQVEQVLMNLVVNARDAMPDGGTITIEAENRIVDEKRWVMLAVTDSGMGISPEVKQHLFEPFFTTKEAGKGTGLGLATVYGIVNQAGGLVRVESELGQGARFEVLLPQVETPVLPAPPEPTREQVAARGGGLILVVEDNDAVRGVVRRVLTKLGYTILEAETGKQALDVFGKRSGWIDLLITDMVMPEMSGAELVERLRESEPRLRVLYMSGYAKDAVTAARLFGAGSVYLEKPFTPAVLALKVQELLASSS